MLHSRLQSTQDEEGFTLIELLVVVLIIGILTAIAVPAFFNQRKRAFDANTESDARNGAMTLSTVFLDQMLSEDPSLTVQGGGWSEDELVKFSVLVGGGSQSSEYVLEDFFQLKQGTRGAVAGTASDFSVCYWNPAGYAYATPATAAVWRSTEDQGGGTFRPARPDDDCIAMGELLDVFLENGGQPPAEEPTEEEPTEEPTEEEPPWEEPDEDNPLPFRHSDPRCEAYESAWIDFQLFVHSLDPTHTEMLIANRDASGNLVVTSQLTDFIWNGTYHDFPSEVNEAQSFVNEGRYSYGELVFSDPEDGSQITCMAGTS